MIRNINLCLVELPKFWSFPSSGLLWFWTGVTNIPGSGPGTPGTLVSGVVLPGQQVAPRGRFLAGPAAADGSVPSVGTTFTGLLGEGGSEIQQPGWTV